MVAQLCEYNRFFKDFISLFLERGRKRGRIILMGETYIAFHMTPNGDLARNPRMCPDWEWNQKPSGLRSMPNLLSNTNQG